MRARQRVLKDLKFVIIILLIPNRYSFGKKHVFSFLPMLHQYLSYIPVVHLDPEDFLNTKNNSQITFLDFSGKHKILSKMTQHSFWLFENI